MSEFSDKLRQAGRRIRTMGNATYDTTLKDWVPKPEPSLFDKAADEVDALSEELEGTALALDITKTELDETRQIINSEPMRWLIYNAEKHPEPHLLEVKRLIENYWTRYP